MYVKDIVELTRIKLVNLPISKNETALINFIYLGVSELYNRFNLSIRSETIETNPNLALYELKNTDVSLLLSIYNRIGEELKQTDVINSRMYDYKLVNYRSFILKNPKQDLLYAVYKASPVILKDLDDEIDLPSAMINALLTYISYASHTSINRDNMNESSFYFQQFNMLCQDLEMQGYKISLNTENYTIQFKGYI